jgi:hypothetical protein
MLRRLLVLAAVPLLACGGGAPAHSSASPSAGALLTLGDGRVSTGPRAGYTWSCQSTFNGQGAEGADPWIRSDRTWDPALKPKVQGDVPWPTASFQVSTTGGERVIKTQDLPVGEGSGTFPISATDPAFKYDRNPNSLTAQGATVTLDLNPALAAQPACLGQGPVGVLTDGVFLFDALDALGRDAVPHEVLDRCDGHPAPGGVYHHHDVPSCLLAKATGSSTLVGYAFDGFGIYVERDPAGRLPHDADLDACHGRTSPVDWDGRTVTMYHYVATAEYPYVIGCYRGTPPTQTGGPPP